MELKVNGFSHKMPLLLEQLVKALVTLKVRITTLFQDLPLMLQPCCCPSECTHCPCGMLEDRKGGKMDVRGVHNSLDS